jgi:hypothetical protein
VTSARPRRRRRPPGCAPVRPHVLGSPAGAGTAPIKLGAPSRGLFVTIRFDHNKVRGFATPRRAASPRQGAWLRRKPRWVASPQAKVRGFATSQAAWLRHKPSCVASPQAKLRGFATTCARQRHGRMASCAA